MTKSCEKLIREAYLRLCDKTGRDLRAISYVCRKTDQHILAMNWQPDNGRRRPGRPMKTWRTTVNEDLRDIRLTWMGAERSASDRPKWRKLVADIPAETGGTKV